MKFIFTKTMCFFLLTFVVNTIFSQTPQKMSYQAVIRNSGGNLIVDTPVRIKITILHSSTSGTAVFSETHNPITSSNGLATIEIGVGSAITGTFGNINWGSGPYFIKTETDPTGGTNYTISGTSQLLSVPYALYAEKTKYQGRNSIYIKNNITNAEAQTIIQEQFGPNTENIYVLNTIGLTNLDFSTIPNLTNLSNLKIVDNKNLVSVNTGTLNKCHDNLIITNNPLLTQANLPMYYEGDITISTSNNLNQINFPLYNRGNVKISNNINLQSIQLPQFANGDLDITSNPLLSSLVSPQYTSGFFITKELPSLLEIVFPLFNGRLFVIENCNSLETINLPSVTTLQKLKLNNYPEPFFYYNNSYADDLPNLKNILLPALGSVTDFINISGLNVENLTLTSLSNVPNFSVLKTKLTSLNVPSLVSSNLIKVKKNDFLQSLNFGNLVSAWGIDSSFNPVLNSINISNLSTLLGSATNYSYFAYNALPSSQINNILNKLLTVSPAVPKTVGLDHQSPLAPPTGAGITAKATLINQGNLISTD